MSEVCYEILVVFDTTGSGILEWRRHKRSRCYTRIRRRCALHSCCWTWGFCTGHCRGHTWWTSCYYSNWTNQKGSPNTRIFALYSELPRLIRRRNGTEHSTRCDSEAAGQISAYNGRAELADWAFRCRASSCLSCHWIRLYTPATNDWRRRPRRLFAELALESS